jgi:hypothetical protein
MKKTAIILLIVISISNTLFAQKLEKNAIYIKDNFSNLFELNIRNFAIEKWKNDSSMVYNEINKQSDALTDLLVEFKSSNSNILYKSIIKSSLEGKSISNAKKWNQIKAIGFGELLELECDWTIVQKEYEKQLKEKYKKIKIASFIAIPIVIGLFLLSNR